MADIEIDKQHNLEFSKARQQAKQWLDEAKKEYGLDANYVEGEQQDSLTIKRMGIDGKATLDAQKIHFEANLGFVAKPLKGKIKNVISKGIDKYFT